MAIRPYVPLSVRARRHFAHVNGLLSDETLSKCTVLRWLGEKIDRDPSVIGTATLLLLLMVLLLNPGHAAPCLANALGMIPAWQGFRLLTNPGLPLEYRKAATSCLLDYWVVFATSTFLEQTVGHAQITSLLPGWWAVKGVAIVWFLLASAVRDVQKKASRPKSLTLRRDISMKRMTLNGAPDQGSPSPSPAIDAVPQKKDFISEAPKSSAILSAFAPPSPPYSSASSHFTSSPIPGSSSTENDPFAEDLLDYAFDKVNYTPESEQSGNALPGEINMTQLSLSTHPVLQRTSPMPALPSPFEASDASSPSLSPPLILPPTLESRAHQAQLAPPEANAEVRKMSLDELLASAEDEEAQLQLTGDEKEGEDGPVGTHPLKLLDRPHRL